MRTEHVGTEQFELFIRPVSAGRPFVHKTGAIGETKSYRTFKKAITDVIERDVTQEKRESIKHLIEQSNVFEVHISLNYKVANSTFWGMPMPVKPDLDNVMKSIFDQVLDKFGMEDDKMIFRSTIEKWYYHHDSMEIELKGYHQSKYQSRKRKKRPKQNMDKKFEDLTDEEILERLGVKI